MSPRFGSGIIVSPRIGSGIMMRIATTLYRLGNEDQDGEILGDEKAKIDEPVTWLIASDIARNLRVFALD